MATALSTRAARPHPALLEDVGHDLVSPMTGHHSAREIVADDPSSAFRWYTHDYPTAMARWNHHPEYELHLIRSGTGKVLVGDHVGAFSAGYLALIGPNLPHDWISDLTPGERIAGRDVVLQFQGRRFRRAFDLFPELEEVEALLQDAARGIAFTGATALAGAQLLETIGQSAGLERLKILFALLTTLTRAPENERVLLASPIFAVAQDSSFDVVVRYIRDNIYNEISMAEAARLAGLSETCFSRTFKRMAGRNFVDFVRTLRISQARRLLRQSNMPVSVICYDIGFGNLSNFNRQFRMETGISPSEYRRQMAERALPATADSAIAAARH